MTEQKSATEVGKPEEPLRPPRLNGPAVLAFGALMIVGGLSIKFNPMVYVGAACILIGAWGIYRTKHWEKEHGIEEVLPGGGRYDAKGNVKDEAES